MSPTRPAALAFAWAGAALFGASLAVFAYVYLVSFGRTVQDGPALPAALFDAALFSGFALHHSVFARHAVRAWMARTVSARLERAVYVWLASVLFLAVCLSWRAVPGLLYSLPGPAAIAGYLVQAAGLVLTLRSSAALGLGELAGLRAARGHEPAEGSLQTSGLYGIVRHPLYFAWVLMVFGAPHMTMTRFVFAVVSTGYLAAAIPFEERGLIRVYGDAYHTYTRRVRWRMVPGIY
ncbi:MAG TPA: isoprenylcysteine carboxylmethyltransferase family protein [Vicinamibacterales bacterium]|jgi:protein-S-isoprenylcysteine O-methyltransferase Ste14|nr:isoprenylcysteine carboxylmethyltransferase family protein [Vicinamibacterales bacterium]